jgi:hypothetical protein
MIQVPLDQATIQGGINIASDGDTILVSEGVYHEYLSFNGKSITVASAFIIDHDTSHIAKTCIVGNNNYTQLYNSMVYFYQGEDTTSVLCGFTITGGTGSLLREWDAKAGGGIFIYYSGAKIINNIIEMNTISWKKAAYGGGIMIYGMDQGEQVIIENNIISDNKLNGQWEAGGGALFVYGTTGKVRISNNKIFGNTAFSETEWAGGGGIYCGSELMMMEKMEISISDNEIYQNNTKSVLNKLYGGGGAIHIDASAPSITGNQIYNNESDNGGGISIENGSNAILSENIIRENRALEAGGGMYIQYASAQMINCTILSNHAARKTEICVFNGSLDTQNSKVPGEYLKQDSYYLANDIKPQRNYSLLSDSYSEPGGNANTDLRYYLYIPEKYNAMDKYPLLIYFSNSGAGGLDVTCFDCSFNEKESYPLFELAYNNQKYGKPSLVLVIKLPFKALIEGETPTVVKNFLAYFKEIYPVDSDRIYVLGMSAGAHAAYHLMVSNPNLFAAAVPISGHYLFDPCGTALNNWSKNIRHIPAWLFHGEKDGRVCIDFSRNMISALKATGRPAISTKNMDESSLTRAMEEDHKLIYTEFENIGHFYTRKVFENPLLYKWLFSQHKPYVNVSNVQLSSSYISPDYERIQLKVQYANRYDHNFTAQAIIYNSDSSYTEPVALFDDGNNGDEQAGDGIWSTIIGPMPGEDEYRIGFNITDLDSSETYHFHDMARFTTIGPLEFAGDTLMSDDQEINPGDYLKFRFKLKNSGRYACAKNVTIKVLALDSDAYPEFHPLIDFGDIKPGETVLSKRSQYIRFSDAWEGKRSFRFAFEIYSNGYHFWTDSTAIITTTRNVDKSNHKIVKEYNLNQNYPNPFNPTTVISWQVGATCKSPVLVDLSIYNLLGQKVATLASSRV